jgi:hypothetical protein
MVHIKSCIDVFDHMEEVYVFDNRYVRQVLYLIYLKDILESYGVYDPDYERRYDKEVDFLAIGEDTMNSIRDSGNIGVLLAYVILKIRNPGSKWEFVSVTEDRLNRLFLYDGDTVIGNGSIESAYLASTDHAPHIYSNDQLVHNFIHYHPRRERKTIDIVELEYLDTGDAWTWIEGMTHDNFYDIYSAVSKIYVKDILSRYPPTPRAMNSVPTSLQDISFIL